MHAKPSPTIFLLALGASLLTTSAVVTAQTAQLLDVTEATIAELGSAMARGEVTSVELVDAYLARIEAYDQQGPRLNAIIQVNPRAREEAAALDAERREGEIRGPLHGVPIILKDNYDTADMPTTAGSVALAAASTMVGFGSLSLSHYPGLQSMGKVAILGAVCTCVVAISILPAYLSLRIRRRERELTEPASGAAS